MIKSKEEAMRWLKFEQPTVRIRFVFPFQMYLFSTQRLANTEAIKLAERLLQCSNPPGNGCQMMLQLRLVVPVCFISYKRDAFASKSIRADVCSEF
ncbi:hypothetical protein CDAR_68091 [Caerostris darwini]|uniref:Uncharacterized protein n=1 Tax=Caerostris darwini TaxID=1538125 RepID=A0AAV4VUF5_9ARAC|nr:hypothetical protein CDAR_68091 [Caerostris darwini]